MLAARDSNGFVYITRRGKRYASVEEMKIYMVERYLSLDVLNPDLRRKIYSDFLKGEFDSAAFKALKLVEVRAREIGGLSSDVHGKGVFQELFSPECTQTLPDDYSEKDRGNIINLFRASYELYRNPSGHRDIDMKVEEAVEIIMLANHLLRILDKVDNLSVQSIAA